MFIKIKYFFCSYKTKDRQDVRLPKYLEKQKREREELKQKELLRDRSCPLGYEPLTEEERLKALNTAQKSKS